VACGNEDDVGLSSAAWFGAHAYVILCVSSCARGDIVRACLCVRGCARACVTRYVACGLGVHGCACLPAHYGVRLQCVSHRDIRATLGTW
jgi:hypothetical protein